MKRIWLTGLFMVALALASNVRAGDEADGAKTVKGTWSMVSGEKAGQTVPAKDAAALVVEITDDALTFMRGDKREVTKVAFDDTASPKQITLTSADGKVRPGIYEMEGDQLKLCLSGTDARPTNFTTKCTKNALLVLARKIG